jgi:hypothetical protein
MRHALFEKKRAVSVCRAVYWLLAMIYKKKI